jgi:type IV pilus assembly protein PilP
MISALHPAGARRGGPARRTRRLALAALLPLAVMAAGCEEKVNPSTGGPPRAASSAQDGGAGPTMKTGPEYGESDFVESDRNRDPFRTFSQLFVEGQTKRTFDVQRKVLLSQYSIDELKLVAIVMGADYPRAMVVDPAGKGWVLKRGDFVGRPDTVHTGGTNGTDYQLNWRVDRVRDGDLVLLREDPAQPNVAPATRIVALHPEGLAGKESSL